MFQASSGRSDKQQHEQTSPKHVQRNFLSSVLKKIIQYEPHIRVQCFQSTSTVGQLEVAVIFIGDFWEETFVYKVVHGLESQVSIAQHVQLFSAQACLHLKPTWCCGCCLPCHTVAFVVRLSYVCLNL